MDPKPAALRSRIFDELSAADKRFFLAAAHLRSFRRREALVRQGEPALSFFLLESGLVKILQATEKGQDIIVRFVGPGDPVGGVVALDGGCYPVTAVAAEPTQVHAWSRATLQTLLQRFPQVRTNIMREIASHMTDAMSRVRELSTERVGQRLARTILRLMHQRGQPIEGGVLIDHALTRQDLAELTGTTLYTVSRTLTQWEADGVLRSKGRRLVVRSRDRLEARATAAEE